MQAPFLRLLMLRFLEDAQPLGAMCGAGKRTWKFGLREHACQICGELRGFVHGAPGFAFDGWQVDDLTLLAALLGRHGKPGR